MSNKTICLNDAGYTYLLNASLRESALLRRLRDETAALPRSGMQISPEQGQFMSLLVQLMGARRAIEVGVFTGYSALAVALALPTDGYLLACDINEEWTTRARAYWREAGVAEKIELRLAPAQQTLDALLRDGAAGSFDFAFIDADKSHYIAYYERLLQLLRPGGLIAVDNVLWGGAVADPQNNEADTVAIRAFNKHLLHDERVALSLVPIGDGLTLALKRG
ncbi:MAG: class I SAM-dependent methyltransferase [Gammaproteobacteria bacterium]|nr:class I SAM-dependent methyltransferase [Gammaproteobacteria bacterium]